MAWTNSDATICILGGTDRLKITYRLVDSWSDRVKGEGGRGSALRSPRRLCARGTMPLNMSFGGTGSSAAALTKITVWLWDSYASCSCECSCQFGDGGYFCSAGCSVLVLEEREIEWLQ